MIDVNSYPLPRSHKSASERKEREMREFDDLTLGQVISFNPHRGHGWVSDDTGRTLWFHCGDGRYPLIEESSVEWGQEIDEYSRLRLPERGDWIVFEDDIDANTRPKACPWTYAVLFWRQCVTISLEYFRILNDDQIIWEGSYSPLYSTRLTGGRMPESFDTIQTLVKGDIWEAQDGTRGEISECWVSVLPNQSEVVLNELWRASKNPLINATLPPALRGSSGH